METTHASIKPPTISDNANCFLVVSWTEVPHLQSLINEGWSFHLGIIDAR